MSVAGVAHPVERHLAKVEVASSSLVTRSKKNKTDSIGVGLIFYVCGDRLEDINPTVRWTVGHRRLDGDASLRGAQGHRGHEPRHPLRRNTSFPNSKKKGCTFVQPVCYSFAEAACSRRGSNTFFKTRELK